MRRGGRIIVDGADARSAIRLTTYVLVVVGIINGISAVVGRRERWDTSAFDTAMAFPGAPESWGAMILLSALIALLGLVGHWRAPLVGGMFMCGVWCIFFGISVFVDFLHSDDVALADSVVYLALSVVYLNKAAMYWRAK